MSLGNKIYELRTAKNMSQIELAEQLEVSRQAVSKWETDTAIPDLDKLIKLCDLFEVSLDQITEREVLSQNTIEETKSEPKSTSAQKIIGGVFLAVSLVLGFIILLFGKSQWDYIILMPVALAFLVCGLLCLYVKEKALYWCIWTIFAPITVLSPFVIGASFFPTVYLTMVVLVSIMFFVAKVTFKDVYLKITTSKTISLILSWGLVLGVHVLNVLLLINIQTYKEYLFILLDFICYVLIAGLETYTVCYLKSTKNK